MSTRIRCSISPDADDRFMFRAIELGLIDTEGLDFELRTADTHSLNQLADGPPEAAPELCAISFAWYPHLAGRWQLLPNGASVGRGYGPVLVTREPGPLEDLAGARIAVPGTTTTAYTVLRLGLDFEPVVVPITPPELTFEALESGRVEAALLIHEGRLTYAERGLHSRLDLGEWWAARTGGLPLPLGANVVRRDLGQARVAQLNRIVRASIAHGLAHREEAIAWLLGLEGGALRTPAEVDAYLALYANADTLELGQDGRAAAQQLYDEASGAGLLPPVGAVDFAPYA